MPTPSPTPSPTLSPTPVPTSSPTEPNPFQRRAVSNDDHQRRANKATAPTPCPPPYPATDTSSSANTTVVTGASAVEAYERGVSNDITFEGVTDGISASTAGDGFLQRTVGGED